MAANSFAAIPEELRFIPRWVCWKYGRASGDRRTKVPKLPTGRKNADVGDPTTWTDFSTAMAAVDGDTRDGIGFVFVDDDNLMGIDLDDCRDPQTGELTRAAQALVESIDTYTEASPSGTGLHMVMHGNPPSWAKTKATMGELRVEVYHRAHYFTMTGKVIREAPVRERQTEVEALCGVLWSKLSTLPRVAEHRTALSDDEVIRRATTASVKFRALWDGDHSGYPSPSEADLALARLLAYWTNSDRAQMERLWLRSGLYREKLDREDYRTTTLDRALGSMGLDRDDAHDAGSGVQKTPLYYRVCPSIWDEAWSEDAKILALYLLVNRHRITEGLYRLPKTYICSDLAWPEERLWQPFEELLADGFLMYDEAEKVVLIVNALKYQRPDNPNMSKGWARKLRDVPESSLFAAFLQQAEKYAPAFAEALLEHLPERFR